MCLYMRSPVYVISNSSVALRVTRDVSQIRIEPVLHGEPEAAAVPEEPQREQHAERQPDGELRPGGQARPRPQQEIARDGHQRRDAVVHVDRAHPVALRALELQIADRADLVHGEPAAIERRAAAARTPQPYAAADAGGYPPQRLRHRALLSRAPAQCFSPAGAETF